MIIAFFITASHPTECIYSHLSPVPTDSLIKSKDKKNMHTVLPIVVDWLSKALPLLNMKTP